MTVDPVYLVAATLAASMHGDFWDAPADSIPPEVHDALVDTAEARLAE